MPKLSQDQKQLLVVILVCCVAVWGYYQYLMKPTFAAINQKQTEYDTLHANLLRTEQEAKRLPILQRESEKLETDLASMEKQLPTDKDFPSILRIITREALAENLTFQNLRPLDPKRENFFEVIEYEVSMVGPLQSIIRFMASLGQQDRIFQFEKVNFTVGSAAPTDEGTNVSVQFNLKTYAYVG